MTKYIEKTWELYLSKVIPPGESSTQISKIQSAYYAGVLSMYGVVRSIVGPDISEEDGALILQNISTELENFRKHLNGRSN